MSRKNSLAKIEPGSNAANSSGVDQENRLTEYERKSLEKHEETIFQSLLSFLDVGGALEQIQEGRLYREKFRSFEEYCRERWNFSRQRAYQLIDAAKLADHLSTIVDVMPPTNENQVRPLAGSPQDLAVEAWKMAAKKAGTKEITGRLVKQAIDEVRGIAAKENSFDQLIPGFIRGCRRIEKAAAEGSSADWDDNSKERFTVALKSLLRIAIEAGILVDLNISESASDE